MNDPSTSEEIEVNFDFEELSEAFNEEAQRLPVLNKMLKSELKLHDNNSTQEELNKMKQENEKLVSECKAITCDYTSNSFNMDDYKFLLAEFENFKKDRPVECMKLQTELSYVNRLPFFVSMELMFKSFYFNRLHAYMFELYMDFILF